MQTIKTKNLTWVEIKNPTEEDIEWLKKKFNLHPLVLKDLLPPLDYPKIENFGDYLYIVLFYPFFNRKTFQMIPFELDIIVSKNYIITSHYKDIVPLKAIFDKFNLYEDIKKEYAKEGTGGLLYRIIREILSACFPKLGHIKQDIDDVEKAIYRKEYKKTTTKISLVKRDIIGFQRIIESQKLVLRNLAKESNDFFPKKLTPYFRNLLNIYEQINSILTTNRKTLEALNSTNQSFLTNRTNEIIKILTIFSVIVFPLTLLAAVFGMNTNYLPFVGSQNDFWIIIGIMMVATIGMLFFFKFKKWV